MSKWPNESAMYLERPRKGRDQNESSEVFSATDLLRMLCFRGRAIDLVVSDVSIKPCDLIKIEKTCRAIRVMNIKSLMVLKVLNLAMQGDLSTNLVIRGAA
ncbi:hypothetical protein TNIN_80911 [Trichonephila inaurata madagascariensis]|uniref:Uncharacterized protein n=1 Tax=Trichonephila inaurata madagascariensis TaxID=2747483 RepID=A0A8X7BWM4_9ARAC|nr:hypothetical protein TNIN_80911 [Trichonephila inaurata madagascariensis]